jgi:hypothetical protein
MTSLLTTMRQCLADAENDAERLRTAIQILEQSEASGTVTRTATRAAARRGAPRAAASRAAAAATATTAVAPATRAKANGADANGAKANGAAPKATATTSAPTAPAAAASPAPAAARKRKPAPKKVAKTVVPLEKLLKVVGDNPGLTTTAIAKETGGDQSALLVLLKESEQKGDVRRQGQRRATSWFRITDEDRIAARAAEIAAQSKAAAAKGSAKPAKRKVAVAG